VAARGAAQRAVCMARPQMQSALWAGAGRVTMARGFSVSARRLGEGSCMYILSFCPSCVLAGE
jgi:hypothetical protein